MRDTYANKAPAAAYLDAQGIRVYRDGNQLFALEPTFVQDKDGVWKTRFVPNEILNMQDAKALLRRINNC